MSTPFAKLSEIVVESVRALLGVHGLQTVEVAESCAPPRARFIMATIGFGGDAARGALTIVGSKSFWRTYAPSTGATEEMPDALLSDMAGEFSNMTMGMIRNGLLRKGVTVHQAIPTCAFGDDIAFRDPGDAQVAWHRFALRDVELFVRVDASLREDLLVAPNQEQGIEPCTDALVLF